MNVAIIGAGVSGLVTAWLLSREHKVTVFEAADWIGGHTHTVEVEDGAGRRAVDTGFIVYNERNYPNFFRLLEMLGVRTQPTEMSFSVSDARLGLEYKGSDLNGLFAQRANLARPAFWGMLRDITRFNAEARARLGDPGDRSTLGDLLASGRYGRLFDEAYLRPMGAAIWSTRPGQMAEFPLTSFARFFENHGLLDLRNRPQWRTIVGGSREYVRRLTAPFRDRIRLSTRVAGVERTAGGVRVTPRGGEPEAFDRVVLAVHSDQALAMLADADEAEREVLGAIGYQPNDVTLHDDVDRLPLRRRAWSAWNVMRDAGSEDPEGRVTVTYHMNTLQRLEAPREYCVSLNQDARIKPDRVMGRWVKSHPVYTQAAFDAQGRREAINGRRDTYYCGAYWGYGFHEDGVRSGLDVARLFGQEMN